MKADSIATIEVSDGLDSHTHTRTRTHTHTHTHTLTPMALRFTPCAWLQSFKQARLAAIMEEEEDERATRGKGALAVCVCVCVFPLSLSRPLPPADC